MYNERFVSAGSTLSFSWPADRQLALDNCFTWLVDDVAVTASLVPVSNTCGGARQHVAVELSPEGTDCQQGRARLYVRFTAPLETGSYELVQVISRLNDLPTRLEVVVGRFFVKPAATAPTRSSPY
jgi:hypothetical protein